MAHFEPETVRVRGEGVFPRLGVSLPRSKDERYAALLDEASAELTPVFQMEAMTPGLKAGEKDVCDRRR